MLILRDALIIYLLFFVIFTYEKAFLLLPSIPVLSFHMDVVFFVYGLWLPNGYDLLFPLYNIEKSMIVKSNTAVH